MFFWPLAMQAFARHWNIGRLKCGNQVVQAGKRMGLVRGVLRKESDGSIVSLSEHHICNVDSGAKAKL